ncbi:hypothetical protein [Aeromicrobium sp. CTD01-1L150]
MLTTVLQAAEEGAEHAAIHPIAVGVLSFGALALLMIALLVFGKGREHS